MPAKPRKLPRRWLTIGAGAVIVVGLAYAFAPRALPVDIGAAERRAMTITIDEEAKTRVRDAYVVSAPIAGRLLRVDVEPGDAVIAGETVIARILAAPPSALDVRTREQAEAAVSAAEASLRVARADLNSALAEQDLANTDAARARALREDDFVSQEALDRALRAKRVADAAVDTAKAAISMREAELANARAQLISFDDVSRGETATAPTGEAVPLTAPISGRILQVMQKSETVMAAGAAILEIGDVSNDLEIIAELLSSDAVQVKAGDRVVIDNWGGDHLLGGVVERIEPWGFTKYSALGVEEQRVNVIIGFADPLEARESLGHGYRVEAQIVVWEDDDALTAPSSALFRANGGWAVFEVRRGRARLTPVTVTRNNGVIAAIADGLEPGAQVVLYPGPSVEDGVRIVERKSAS